MPLVRNRKWLDVGSGFGGQLDVLAKEAGEILAVEPQADARACLESLGYRTHPWLEEVPDQDINTITLFHTFEHIADPMGMLKQIRQHLRPGGSVVIEVPHAADLLLSFLDLEAFKSFTFWSEHLILHTRQSLQRMLEVAGFENISIEGVQRYPLANHLHWLSQSRPGGHERWSMLRSEGLDREYSNLLKGLDATDTLWATATAPLNEG